MDDDIITTELEALLIEYEPTLQSVSESPPDTVEIERNLTRGCAMSLLGIFYDVSRDFVRINLGIYDE